MNNNDYPYKRVGYLRQKTSSFLGIQNTGVIYASPGVIKHIRKNHYKQLLLKGDNSIIELMRKIAENPDYVGIHYRDDEFISLEFIKKFDRYILLGIEIDINSDYIYVCTMYPITQGKISSRMINGKIYQSENI